MNRLKDNVLVSLAAFALLAAGAQCGGSSGSGSQNTADGATPEGGGQEAGAPDATLQGSPDAGDTGAEAATSVEAGADTGETDGAESTDSGAVGTEPAYLRNDAIGGFAYTSNFGSPYDSILGAPLNTTQSAIATGFQTAAAAGLLVQSENFQLIANSADLYSALDISASLSVSAGLAKVNAKTDFAESTTIDSTDLWVLADFSQVGTAQKIVNPTLSPQAAALSPGDFYALYGDRYAAEIVTGQEMFCTIQIQTFSQDDKSELTTSLGFSYGASSGSASFSQKVMNATSNRNVTVTCKELGFQPTTVVMDLPSLLQAASAFTSNTAGTLGNVTTSALYILYTSYYGIPGYPGVPVGTADKVAQQGQLASDYLLYNSLVTNDFSAYYADSAYSSLPFFAHMKAYRDGLATFLNAAINDSQAPGIAPPTSSADGVITDWVTSTTLTSQADAGPSQYTVHGLANGIVPKRISDYDIPLRYAYPDASGVGTYNGVSFAPVTPVPSVASLSTAVPPDYQLYTVNKPGSGGGYWLEYQWDTGTYYFPNVTNATTGAPNPTALNGAITQLGLSGKLSAQYVLVNKANGLVLTDNGATAAMTASHFSTGSKSQLWEFYLDAGNVINNCNTYVSPGGPAGVNCAVGNNGVTSVANNPPCGSLLYGVSTAAIAAQRSGYWNVSANGQSGSPVYSNGGGGCSDCNWNCGAVGCEYTNCGGGPEPFGDFFLQSADSGNSQAIYNYAASPGGIVSYMVTDQTQTQGNLPPQANSPETVEVIPAGPATGNANALWVFIPATDVDTTP